MCIRDSAATARARASSAIYRTFLLRELRPLARGRYRDRRLAVPALIATGAADPVVGPDLIAGLGRHAGAGARTEVIARAGHFVPEEAPAALLALLREHLAGAGHFVPEEAPEALLALLREHLAAAG